MIGKGARVLIKPNMLAPHAPEEAVTTHPAVVAAVVQMVRERGAVPLIGDSPGGGGRNLPHLWSVTGMQKVADETGATLVSFENSGSVTREIDGITYYIAKPVVQADAVISVAKLKTHALARYTGAVKNMYGCMPGFSKADMHKAYPFPEEFARVIAGVYGAVMPCYSIVDGIEGIEGDGPSTRGDKRAFGMVLAGADGVAVDTVITHYIGYGAGDVDYLQLAATAGWGCADFESIDCKSDNFEVRTLSKVTLPNVARLNYIPRVVVNMVKPFLWVRPTVEEAVCVGCGKCDAGCPVTAITMQHGKPTFNYTTCISCMCCLELCPVAAIRLKRSFLAKMMK